MVVVVVVMVVVVMVMMVMIDGDDGHISNTIWVLIVTYTIAGNSD